MPPRSKQPTTRELMTDLKAVSKVKKPKGPRKRKPAKLPQKKRTSALAHRTRKIKEADNLAHITKAIVREGGTVADVGMILGCAAIEGSEEWLAELKARELSVAEFMEIAKTRADIDLIRVAVKAATGYGYEEESQEFLPVYNQVEGRSAESTGKYEPGKKRIQKRHQAADTTLLKFLLSSRMPEYFIERKEIKIDKRVVEIKANAKAEITGFCAGVLKAFGEPVDTEFVERKSLDG